MPRFRLEYNTCTASFNCVNRYNEHKVSIPITHFVGLLPRTFLASTTPDETSTVKVFRSSLLFKTGVDCWMVLDVTGKFIPWALLPGRVESRPLPRSPTNRQSAPQQRLNTESETSSESGLIVSQKTF